MENPKLQVAGNYSYHLIWGQLLEIIANQSIIHFILNMIWSVNKED